MSGEYQLEESLSNDAWYRFYAPRRLAMMTPADFEAQVALVSRDFDAVSLSDVLAALDDARRLPRRAVLVTFDDGYRDFATNAWPILRRASVPATRRCATARLPAAPCPRTAARLSAGR